MKRLQRSLRSQPKNAQLSSRIAALRAEIVAHGTSLEHSRWSALCDGLDSALHSRSTWSLFKSFLGTKPALAPTLAKALTQGTPSEVFDKLTSLYLPPPLTPSYPAYSGDPNPDLDRPFTLRELEAALAANASRSAPGEDTITYTTLRNLPDHSMEFLLQTFNNAWDSGCLPSAWTSSLISMIPKPGKPPSLSNLRPISLTSCVGKTLERMALTRLSDLIEAKDFFPHSLIGFRRRVCAQDMFLILQHTFLSPNPSQIHALVTVDVRKAFDGVCHDHILSQISSLDCGHRMYSYLRSFLSNRVARFRVDTHLSDPHPLTRGTPQGAVLSPILFNLAMTPLASQLAQIPDLHHIFYADDITLWCSSGSPGHVQDTLQRGLDLINSFLPTAGLSPAPEKSELLLLNYSSYQRSHNALISLHLSGSPIPVVPQCKVLGFPLHAAKNVQALHHAVRTCHSVTHLLRRVVTRRSGLHEAHACRVAHALALNKFLYFVPYVSFTHTQLNTLETALVGLYKAALNLPITTSTAKLFATGLFHPLRSLLSLHRDSQLARLSLTRQGQWLLAQAGISPIPVSSFTSPKSTPAPNLRILPLPSNMSPVLHAGRRHAAAQHHSPLFTTQGVAYTDASFIAPRGSCGYAIYHPHLPAPETHTSGPYLHPPDALSLEVLAIVHALQSFPSLPSLPEYTIYTDSQAAIRHIQNRTLPHSLQQEVERAVSALQPSTVFLRWVPGHSGIDGNELAHQLARDVFNRAPLIPWSGPSQDSGGLSLRRTIKEIYLQLRLDKRLYPPPHPSLTVPEARLLRHIQMNALVTPSRLFLYRYRSDPSCPNCPSTYADLSHCLFYCPTAQQSSSYPPPSLSITTWLDWLGAEGEEEQRRLAAQAVDMLGL
ncbi:uncharacterized protein [Dermacentor albipictus]|uniref:uncharacterized protein n=1 Tax=Dermacentor albipictus TaxID=60249 RepID=UPI0038FCEA68